MTPRAKILAIRIREKQEKNPELAQRLGIRVEMVERDCRQDQRRMEPCLKLL